MNKLKKKCTQCLEIKPIELFSSSQKGKYGKLSQCKSCRAENRIMYKSRDKLNRLVKKFPECITSESYDIRIDDLYHEVQMDNLSKGFVGFNVNNKNAKEVDHIIPLSKGGLHTISNLQVLTVSENRSKKQSERKIKE